MSSTRKIPEKKMAKIAAYAQKATIVETAEQFGVSVSTVSRAKKKLEEGELEKPKSGKKKSFIKASNEEEERFRTPDLANLAKLLAQRAEEIEHQANLMLEKADSLRSAAKTLGE